MSGWIKLHRQIQESSFYGQPIPIAIWVECLLRASHDSRERFIGREKVFLPAGSFVMGLQEMADAVGCGKATVKSWLDAFEKEGMLDRRRTPKGTICKLKKWSEYQDTRPETDRGRTADGPLADPNKNVKNVKKVPERQANFTDEQIGRMESDFKRVVLEQEWCDVSYADKSWDQSRLLRTDNRREFYRKVTLMLTWARLPKHLGRAKLLFHEIAGFVNDRGQMERVLDDKEIAERRQFALAESGESYVNSEL